MKLQFLDSQFSICRLDPADPIPGWANGEFVAIVRTVEELTIIAATSEVPNDVTAEHDYACFRVAGRMDFDVVGVIAAISRELADARIPILAVSTFDTDYFFVKSAMRNLAQQKLVAADYEFSMNEG